MKSYLLVLWLSFKWIFRINLGDRVWFNGKRYTVCNGVIPTCWRLCELENDDNGWVRREHCRKSWTPANMIRSFCSGYRFYMLNWFDIWKRQGIKDWMRRCNIW